MNIADILQQLGSEEPTDQGGEQLRFPREALQAAKAQWAEFWPAVDALMQRMNTGEELSDEEYQQLFFGVLLLVDLADLSKAPAFFAWVDTDDGLGSDLEYTLGDALTEEMPSLLYIMAAGDSAPLLTLARSDKAGELVKSAALAALFAQFEQLRVQAQPEHIQQRQSELVLALVEIIENAVKRGQAFVLSEIAIWCLSFGLEQFKVTFQTLLRQNKLDLAHVTSRQINQWRSEGLGQPLASGLVQPSFEIESVSSWLAFQTAAADSSDDAEAELDALVANAKAVQADGQSGDAAELWRLARERLLEVTAPITDAVEQRTVPLAKAKAAGVGRNDPCPCGSGKKFKKCCGA